MTNILRTGMAQKTNLGCSHDEADADSNDQRILHVTPFIPGDTVTSFEQQHELLTSAGKAIHQLRVLSSPLSHAVYREIDTVAALEPVMTAAAGRAQGLMQFERNL